MLRTEPASGCLFSLPLESNFLDECPADGQSCVLRCCSADEQLLKYFLIKAKFSDVRLAVTRGLTLKHLG
jgi:hypothetical protein